MITNFLLSLLHFAGAVAAAVLVIFIGALILGWVLSFQMRRDWKVITEFIQDTKDGKTNFKISEPNE